MEKTEELASAKQMTFSPSSIPTSSTHTLPEQLNSKVREEGELSSSSDEETPTVLVTPPPAATRTTPVESKNTSSVNGPRSSRQTFNRYKFEKNSATPKSSTSGRFLPSRTDNNLVIRFSDGESSSDSEDNIQEKSLESRDNGVGCSGVRRPPATLSATPMREITRNTIIPMPKKLSLCRPFVAAVAELNGSKSRGSATYSMEHVSRPRDLGAPNKNFANYQLGRKQGVDLDDSKLQGLREQIEVLESELKLKSSQQSKETLSSPFKAYIGTSTIQTKDKIRKGRAASAEPEELPKKRLKVSRPNSPHFKSVNLLEVPTATPDLMPKELLTSGGSNMQDNMKFDYGRCDKINIPVRIQPNRRKQDDNQLVVPIGTVTDSTNDCADPKAGWRQQFSSIERENVDAVRTVLPNFTGQSHEHYSSPSLKDSATCRPNSNSTRSNENCKVVSGDKTLLAVDGTLESAEDSPKNAVLWNCKDTVNDSGPEDTTLHSLFEIEQLQEKELNEALEYRRRCEIEEINSLKAYRIAQITLVEANARCSALYREREVLSARFQSSTMENLSFPWLSKQHEHPGIRFNSSNDISGGNLDLVPKSNHHLFEYGASSRRGCNSNIRRINEAPVRRSYGQFDRRQLGSDPSSEPDGSTSDTLVPKGSRSANRLSSQSRDSNRSADDDEDTFSCDEEPIELNQGYVEREKVINDSVRRNSPIKDTVLLEATLRSKLVAQLGARSLSKGNGQNDDMVEPLVERGAGCYPESENRQRGMEVLPYSVAEKSQHPDLQGTRKPEKIASKVPNHIDNQFSSQLIAEPENAELRDSTQQTISVNISNPSISQSASGHVKVTSPNSFRGSSPRNITNRTSTEKNEPAIQPSSLVDDSMQATGSDLFTREINSYTSTHKIDPFWPLCMYELRGKCNNDECPWQHIKDYHNADSQIGSLADQGKHNDAHTLGQCWQKAFSVYLAVSRLLQRESPMAELASLDKDGRTEIQGSWSRQSFYFQYGGGNQPKQHPPDYIHSLERALIILNQEAHRTEGMKKALSVMSRALEISPTSVPVWVVYLLICNSNKKFCVNNVDMFFHAVKHNEGSYELWILYINNRHMLLSDRMRAYTTALTALCRSVPNRDTINTSACILDLFLQMMDLFCMSDNFEEAMQTIHKVCLSTTKSNDPHTLFPSDLLTLLTLSDQCIFWVCCVYVVIYRKLPDAILQQFERDKKLDLEEWPFTEIDFQKKELAIRLMEKAMDSIQMDIRDESLQSVTGPGSVHVFALNHVKCIEALEDRPCCRNLLEKYMKLYPSCLELFLMSARMQEDGLRDLTCAGFNEALSKWSKEHPGIQCIWNKYMHYALENEGIDVAKEVMLRWFHSVSSVQSSQNIICDVAEGDSSLKPLSENQITFSSNKLDNMFGMLNLGLYRLLENDQIEAHLAFDSALKAAPTEYYKLCVRQHATFLQKSSSQSEDSPFCVVLNIQRSYLADAQSSLGSEPLSRRFIQDIKKPRVQNLIKDILSPISSNVTLVNLVLEVWYGASLLPSKFDNLKDLVDFVENIIELVPSNYQVAFSVCKLLTRDFNSSSALYWASSVLANAIFNSIPVPPEYVFLEASGIVENMKGVQGFSEMFHTRALEVYPFSVKLWKSHLKFSKSTKDKKAVVEAAKERGIKLFFAELKGYKT